MREASVNSSKDYNGGVSLPLTSSIGQMISESISNLSRKASTASKASRDRQASSNSVKRSNTSIKAESRLSSQIGLSGNAVESPTDDSPIFPQTSFSNRVLSLREENKRSSSDLNNFLTQEWPVICRSKSSFSIGALQDARPSSPTKSLKSTTGEGFLKDIELNGFSGIWSHPITRCYFLMYLLWTKQANLYVSFPPSHS